MQLPRPQERPYGEGVYRRRIGVRLAEDGSACGELEDDFHHFRVDLTIADDVVTDVTGTPMRGPWSMCMTAGDPIRDVVGTRLATGPLALRHLPAKQNCTHLFDLTGLVVAHAARGEVGDRVYDFTVADKDDDDIQVGTIWRDGEELFAWHVKDRALVAPADWLEVPLWNRFIDWAGEHMDDETAEAAVALRRVFDISVGRVGNLDQYANAAELVGNVVAICHAFQPHNAPVALRNYGSDRDYTDHPDELLKGFVEEAG